MTDIGDEDRDHVETVAQDAAATKEAWTATLDDMEAMVAERETDGWETIRFPAGDTAPENPAVRESDRFGLVFVVPKAVGDDPVAERLREAFDGGSFPESEVYRREMNGTVFLVVEYRDPDRRLAVFVAGQYMLTDAHGMVKTAEKSGEFYVHFQRLDATPIGTVEHEDHHPFVPHADRIDEWNAAARAHDDEG
ncbi:hypothetical protein BRD17_04100 [Halobacteriales archaeon SW_7_68_16]|nr:MAG: hypothetical protein BRD17_04100 [Halobacteriales archaeon SW_7_68_16]